MNSFKLSRAVLVVLLVAPTLTQAESTSPGTPDREIGLSKTSVFDVASPEVVIENESSPGERPLVPRVNPIAPPVVPHGVAEWLPITRADNSCVDCHHVDEKVAGEPTPIPASHFTDLRHKPGQVGDELIGARYVCTACHVSLTESKALVENRFEVPAGD